VLVVRDLLRPRAGGRAVGPARRSPLTTAASPRAADTPRAAAAPDGSRAAPTRAAASAARRTGRAPPPDYAGRRVQRPPISCVTASSPTAMTGPPWLRAPRDGHHRDRRGPSGHTSLRGRAGAGEMRPVRVRRQRVHTVRGAIASR
jgi:hypothetical protein